MSSSAAESNEQPPSTDDKKEEAPAVDKKQLKENFEAYGKFGDKTADGRTIKLSQSDKWFKQAKIIDNKKISTVDTGIAFRKISKNGPKLSFTDWNKYLDEIAKNKKIDGNELRSKLIECGKPGVAGTTSVVKSKAVDRLTDASKYGGTHKERFDSSGKGKGLEGRVDGKSDGYVAGYKNKNTYGNKKTNESDNKK